MEHERVVKNTLLAPEWWLDREVDVKIGIKDEEKAGGRGGIDKEDAKLGLSCLWAMWRWVPRSNERSGLKIKIKHISSEL